MHTVYIALQLSCPSSHQQGQYTKITFRTPLYLGGAPSVYWLVRAAGTNRGFQGCIQALNVNGKLVDLRPWPLGSALSGADVGELAPPSRCPATCQEMPALSMRSTMPLTTPPPPAFSLVLICLPECSPHCTQEENCPCLVVNSDYEGPWKWQKKKAGGKKKIVKGLESSCFFSCLRQTNQ